MFNVDNVPIVITGASDVDHPAVDLKVKGTASSYTYFCMLVSKCLIQVDHEDQHRAPCSPCGHRGGCHGCPGPGRGPGPGNGSLEAIPRGQSAAW